MPRQFGKAAQPRKLSPVLPLVRATIGPPQRGQLPGEGERARALSAATWARRVSRPGGERALLQPRGQRGDLGLRPDLRARQAQIAAQRPRPPEHVFRHLGLRSGRADKGHDRVDPLGREPQTRLDNLDMFVILSQRVLKTRLVPGQDLGPARLPRIAKDPACHGLRLDHEDPAARDHHMVDLRRALRRGQRQIMQRETAQRREIGRKPAPHPRFASRALGRGGGEISERPEHRERDRTDNDIVQGANLKVGREI